MDARAVLRRLENSATPIGPFGAPPDPGVYALYLEAGSVLPGLDAEGVIYLGMSSNLAEREYATHFSDGQTGFSTVRRSIGALLTGELQLRSRPRGTGASDSNYTNYRFDDEGERRLSRWMEQHLRLAITALSEPAAVEGELISLARPVLNLKGWPNPEARRIKQLRRQCVDEARQEHPRA